MLLQRAVQTTQTRAALWILRIVLGYEEDNADSEGTVCLKLSGKQTVIGNASWSSIHNLQKKKYVQKDLVMVGKVFVMGFIHGNLFW